MDCPLGRPLVLYTSHSKWSAGDLARLREKCHGIRVFYYNPNNNHCDHPHKQREWMEKMACGDSLEAGTVIDLAEFRCRGELQPVIMIQWDCGFPKAYTEPEMVYLRVFDLGPAGYKGEMVFCDKCLVPVMGFAWRLAKESDSGDLYDLCCKHYNENKDPYSRDPFHCNIPSGDLDNKRETERPKLNPRASSDKCKYGLIGLFKDARVKDLCSHKSFKDGRVIRIEHNNKCQSGNKTEEMEPQQDMRNASYYNCCAEIEDIQAPNNPLLFRNAGCKGGIDIEVSIPGKWGSVYATHHPSMCIDLLREIATYEDKCFTMTNGNKCFMRRKQNNKCYSMTICGTKLEEISEPKMFEECQDLEIVILYMNNLSKLPDPLMRFKESISLVCIQNNNFQEIPSSLYYFTELRHLNMHGNYLTNIPASFRSFSSLERVYLGDNDLITLPDIFGNFKNLKKASFEMNNLTRLPPSFSQLSRLENLDISSNAFSKFPQPLLQLKSLQFLNIERNRIQRFTPPKEKEPELYTSTYQFFEQLVHVQIKGNPISEHKAISGLPSQYEVLQKLQQPDVFCELSKIKPTKSLRVNVLGNSGAGKTSFVEAMIFDQYVIPTTEKTHRHTVGIERHYLPVEIGSKTINLHIWDHAGDNEYAMMNDLFISDRTLVWLVVNLNRYNPSSVDTNQQVFQEHIGHWLQMVLVHNLKPVVWIICTHADIGSDYDIEIKKDHIKYWTEQLCIWFERVSGVHQYLMKNLRIIHLTNTFSFKGRSEVYNCLKSLLKSSPVFSYLADPLPIEWQEKMESIQLYTEELNYLDSTSSKLPAIAVREMEEFLANVNAEFLEYLHDIGDIYLMKSLSDDIKSSVAVLSLDWMINLLKKVYHHDFKTLMSKAESSGKLIHVSRDTITEALPMRIKYGIISEHILKVLWKCEQKNEVFTKIVNLFKEFNLIYPLKRQFQSTFYFFPYLTKPGLIEESSSSWKHSQETKLILDLTFSYFLPQFFLQRLALQFWKCSHNHITAIHSGGFQSELVQKSVYLHIAYAPTCCPNSERLKVLIFSNNLNDSWDAVKVIVKNVYLVLNYWKFGTIEWRVVCPNCTSEDPNSMPIFHFREGLNYKTFASNNSLICLECNRSTAIKNLVPPPSTDLSLLPLNLKVVWVQEKESFTQKLPSQWSVKDSPFIPLDSSTCLSYSAHADFDPAQPVSDL